MNCKIPNLSKFLIITSAAKLGTMESASNVLTITISMKTVFAAQYILNVEISTELLEFVKLAMKDMESSMANASESI